MKNNKKKIGLIIVLAVIVVAIILGYTFSKYTESVTIGTSSAVAKWQFTGQITNGENSSTGETTISLADTIDSETITSGNIAPGTSGEFQIIIDATGSEVDIDYTVELENETDKPTNLVFRYDGSKYSSLSELISSIASSGTISKTSEDQEDQTVTYNIEWEWPYETTTDGVLQDEYDLIDGQTISDYVFTVKITGTQVKEAEA